MAYKGFSLLELMIAVTIMSILAALAIPSYQVYIKRARFAEVIGSADLYKTFVTLALAEGAPLGEIKNGDYGVPDAPAATKNVASIVVNKGIITVTATALIDKATYILKPNADASAWEISGTCLQKQYCNS